MTLTRICFIAGAAALALLATPAGAQDTPGLTVQDVARTRSVGSALISPDGKLIAYTLNVPRDITTEDDGPQWTELHLIGSDGSSRAFVSGQVNVGGVQWAGDSTRISFLTKREKDEAGALYVIDVTGGEAQKVFEFDGGIGSYTWRPGGMEIAFISAGPEPEERKKQKEKGFSQEIYEEDRLAPALWIAEVGDDAAEPRKLELPGFPSDPSWSPDGGRLAVALAPTPHIDDSYMRRKFHIVSADSGSVAAKFDTPGKIGSLTWSPDGTQIALIASETLHDPSPGRLYLAPAAGGALDELLPGLLGHVRSAVWSSDTTIDFLADKDVSTHLGEIDLAADRVEGQRKIRWQATSPAIVGSISISEDGAAHALVADSPAHTSEVFGCGRDLAPRRLTVSNPWLTDVRLARQEVVEYVARDGLALQGILIRPLDEQPETRYPLVVVVHGGPESHYRNGWVTWYASGGQALAAKGYAVFYPNYRASTGRGVEFSMLDHGDMAGKEFDDLVDGVDHLVKSGLVDRKKVGVTGGSYGGYASAWCATALTEHFAASVMSVGLSDQVSFAGTTDIPNEMVLVHYRVRPWEDWDLYRERSPIYHTPTARTPILILHGKEDTRVHPSQSLELYRYLKVLGKTPVRLVLYPGEGHGNRRAASRLDYSLRLFRWMDHYLKGPGGDPPPYELDYGMDEESD